MNIIIALIMLIVVGPVFSASGTGKASIRVKSKQEINQCVEEMHAKRKPKSAKAAIDIINICRRK